MRPLLTALCATGILALSGSLSPASAASRYCLQGPAWGYPGNCQFSSYEQCMASASGTYAYCGINPQAYAPQRRGYGGGYGY
jgi:Protein of unknown function (DUF3551)